MHLPGAGKPGSRPGSCANNDHACQIATGDVHRGHEDPPRLHPQCGRSSAAPAAERQVVTLSTQQSRASWSAVEGL